MRCRSSRSERKYSFRETCVCFFRFPSNFPRNLQLVRIGHTYMVNSFLSNISSRYSAMNVGTMFQNVRSTPCSDINYTNRSQLYYSRRPSRNYESTNLGWLVEFVKSSKGLSTKTRTFRRCESLNVFLLKDSSL